MKEGCAFINMMAFYHSEQTALITQSICVCSCGALDERMSFICHIHNYTEYNEQWNVFSAFNPSKCTHLEQWAADCAAPGEQSWTSCRSRDSNPQPWVTSGRVSSPTLYPLGQRLPNIEGIKIKASPFASRELFKLKGQIKQLCPQIQQTCWNCFVYPTQTFKSQNKQLRQALSLSFGRRENGMFRQGTSSLI